MNQNSQKQRRCPTCRAEVTYEGNPHRPFCSDRCRMQDLGKWVSEEYRIPAGPVSSQPDDDAE